VIRPHTGGQTLGGGAASNKFTISKIGAGNIHAVPVTNLVENNFSAVIANNGTCSITSQSSTFLQSCTTTGTGSVTLTLVPGMFAAAPVAVGGADTTGSDFISVQTVSTSVTEILIQTFRDQAGTTNNAGLNVPFHVAVQRQGSDYKAPQGVYLGRLTYPQTCVLYHDSGATGSGGGCTAGSFSLPTLNAMSGDCSGISLASNVITFSDAAEWYARGEMQFYKSDQSTSRLQDTTNSKTLVIGSSVFNSSTVPTNIPVPLSGKFLSQAGMTAEYQGRCATTDISNGYGRGGANLGQTAIWRFIELTRIR